MKAVRLLALLALLPVAVFAADRIIKIDKSRSYVDVDVKATMDSFTGHLDKYDTVITTDAAGKVKTTVFSFKFTDLKTGKTDRDAEMIKWLGGGEPEGKFELGIIAVAPDGQGQVSGRLTFHGVTQRIEFPVNVVKDKDTYTMIGDVTIDYREWGLKPIKKALMFSVGHDVKIKFKLIGTLADAAPAN
ncbi:MAG TPA: YceI family protein [Candidatus Didemnitutus sp.]|nr:YceI family protein [Candidatus Didemnitutus sp.]